MTPAYQRQLRDLVRRFNGKQIRGAEVGVSGGNLSAYLLAEVPNLYLHMVDAWRAPTPGSEYATCGSLYATLNDEDQARRAAKATMQTRFAADRRDVLWMDSVKGAERFADGELDFVFIDGDHTYGGVKEDLAAWYPKVRPGGFFGGHDYGDVCEGVKRAVDEFSKATGSTISVGEGSVWWTSIRTPSRWKRWLRRRATA